MSLSSLKSHVSMCYSVIKLTCSACITKHEYRLLNIDFFPFNVHIFFPLNRHSQTTLVPDCPVGTSKLWDGFSLSFIMGNGRAINYLTSIALWKSDKKITKVFKINVLKFTEKSETSLNQTKGIKQNPV
jgi:hypothetical protein